MRIRIVSLLLVGVVGAGGWWWSARSDSASVSPVLAAAPVSSTGPSVPSSRAPQPMLGDVLRAYYGERWAAVSAEIQTRKELNLDLPVDVSALPDWAHVAQEVTPDTLSDSSDWQREVRMALEWSKNTPTDSVDFSAREYNPDGKTLTEADKARLREVAVPFDAELARLGEQAGAAFSVALAELWNTGRYERAPFVPPPLPKDGRRMRAMRTLAIERWHVTLVFYEGDFPAYDEARARILEMKKLRTLAVADRIRALP